MSWQEFRRIEGLPDMPQDERPYPPPNMTEKPGVSDGAKGTAESTIAENSSDQDDEQNLDIDAYGKAVRAGLITPQIEDEIKVRGIIGLPNMSAAAKKLWKSQGDTRTPIKLKSGDEATADASAAKNETETDAEEDEE
jgi:hypothetical protein